MEAAPLPESQRRRAMGTVMLTAVLDLVGFGIFIPLMTFYAESFSATPEQVTMLMAIFSLAQFVFAPLWGQLSDRIGRRPVLVISIGLTALFLALFASASSLWMLFLFRGLHGMATANISTVQACMADLSSKQNRAAAMGMIGAAFGLGFTIGPVIGGGLSPEGFMLVWLEGLLGTQSWAMAEIHGMGLAFPLWVATFFSLLNFVQALVFLPETRQPGSTPAHQRVSLFAAFSTISHPRLGLLVLLSALNVFAFASMESTFTLFAKHAHGLTAAKVGEMFGIIGIVGIIVQGGLIRPLIKRFGESALVMVGFVVLGLSITAMALVPMGWPMFVAFGAIAVGQGLSSPSLSGLISRSAGEDEQGRVLGSTQAMGALARVFGPLLGGVFFQRVGMGSPFFFASALLLVAAGLSLPATARARGA